MPIVHGMLLGHSELVLQTCQRSAPAMHVGMQRVDILPSFDVSAQQTSAPEQSAASSHSRLP